MKAIYGVVLGVALAGGMPATASAASAAEREAAAECKARAALQYGSGEGAARVTFKGIYGGSEQLKVRMRVKPVQGNSFLSICTVSRRAHEIASLSPVPREGSCAPAASESARVVTVVDGKGDLS